MAKIDFKKELKHLYSSSAKEVVAVDVPAMNFLMVDGEGDPNTAQQYREAGVDYGVMPLEGLWWVDDMAKFSTERKDEWKWTSMIMQPKYVTAKHVNTAIEAVHKKRTLPALSKLRFENFHEGAAAQIMHIGPYSAEGPNIAKIHAFIRNSGHALSGKHHEIYLNDARRAAPEKLKTILRQPMT
jgi:hypothetical protein